MGGHDTAKQQVKGDRLIYIGASQYLGWAMIREKYSPEASLLNLSLSLSIKMASVAQLVDVLLAYRNVLVLLPFIQIIFHLIRNKYQPHIRSIPGPRLAGFTNLWRFWDALTRKPHDTHINLHRQYNSPLVRVGPRAVSFSDPEWIRNVYGLTAGFTKTRFYDMFVLPYRGEYTRSLFTTLDEQYHQTYKRPIANAYSMSTLVEFEPLVDSTTQLFLQRLDEFVESQSVLDLGVWLQMYAFDVM